MSSTGADAKWTGTACCYLNTCKIHSACKPYATACKISASIQTCACLEHRKLYQEEKAKWLKKQQEKQQSSAPGSPGGVHLAGKILPGKSKLGPGGSSGLGSKSGEVRSGLVRRKAGFFVREQPPWPLWVKVHTCAWSSPVWDSASSFWPFSQPFHASEPPSCPQSLGPLKGLGASSDSLQASFGDNGISGGALSTSRELAPLKGPGLNKLAPLGPIGGGGSAGNSLNSSLTNSSPAPNAGLGGGHGREAVPSNLGGGSRDGGGEKLTLSPTTSGSDWPNMGAAAKEVVVISGGGGGGGGVASGGGALGTRTSGSLATPRDGSSNGATVPPTPAAAMTPTTLANERAKAQVGCSTVM